MTSFLSPRAERFLRYWSVNMGIAWESGYTWWPGFSYTEAERARMTELTRDLPGGAMVRYFLYAVIGTLLAAAIAVVVMVGAPIMLLYPDPSKLSPLVFVGLMASVIALILGVGMPLILMAAGWAADRWGGGRPAAGALGDTALYAKVRWQFQRMGLVLAGLFIPGTLLFIAFNIDAGPVAFWLKAICYGLMALSFTGLLMGRAK